MIKKLIKFFIVFVLAFIGIVVFAGLILFFYLNRSGNIFDRIYRNLSMGIFQPFQNVLELEWVNYDDLVEEFENFGSLSISYKEEYLEDNVAVSLDFPNKKNEIKITSSIQLDEQVSIIIHINYEYSSHILTYETIEVVDWIAEYKLIRYDDAENVDRLLNNYDISKDEIKEYQRYLIEDIVLGTWVKANGGNLEREKAKLYKCTIIDNTFNFMEENEPVEE